MNGSSLPKSVRGCGSDERICDHVSKVFTVKKLLDCPLWYNLTSIPEAQLLPYASFP
jgi:hypothetical protein